MLRPVTRGGHRHRIARIVVMVLIIASTVPSVVARQTPSDATPAVENDVQLYVGHGAQLTATIPAQWRPDPTLDYHYAGRSGFISSEPLTPWYGRSDTLATACERVATSVRFEQTGEIEMTDWRDERACLVHHVDRNGNSGVSLVTQHPDPAPSGHNVWIAVTVNAEHFDEITESISFDPSAVTAEAYVDAAIDLLMTHSLWRDSIDWAALREQAHSLLGDQADSTNLRAAQPALDSVITTLHAAGVDGHTYVVPANYAITFVGTVVDSSVYTRPTGSEGDALGRGIGYVSVPGFSGDEEMARNFIRDLRGIIAEQQDAARCGWIVDLRNNTGGNMYPMIAGLAPLLAPGRLIGFHNAEGEASEVTLTDEGTILYDGTQMEVYDVPLSVSDRHARELPLAVLIGPRNGSSGEATALAFTDRDQTRFFGERTVGVATAPTYTYLFDGALLSITTSWMVGPQGAIYPEGVHPDEVIAPSEVIQPLEHDPVVDAATDWLQRQGACGH